jgi:hypothetical protein
LTSMEGGGGLARTSGQEGVLCAETK